VDRARAYPQHDELKAASTPEQGEIYGSEREERLPDEGEAVVTEGNDNKKNETKSDRCLSDAESENGSTTEQEVQDCN
jgi:hypothetical protein